MKHHTYMYMYNDVHIYKLYILAHKEGKLYILTHKEGKLYILTHKEGKSIVYTLEL